MSGDDGERTGTSGRSENDDRQGSSTAEKVITAISVAFTVLVFSYVA